MNDLRYSLGRPLTQEEFDRRRDGPATVVNVPTPPTDPKEKLKQRLQALKDARKRKRGDD